MNSELDTKRTKQPYLRGVLIALGVISLMITFVFLGFSVCAYLPITTQALSSATSNFEDSPFTHDELVSLAVQTRNFTVSDYGRSDSTGNEYSSNDDNPAVCSLADSVINAALVSSSQESPKANKWSLQAQRVLQEFVDSTNNESSDKTSVTSMYALYSTGYGYALSKDAIDHLNDVNRAINSLIPTLIFICIIAIACLIFGFRLYGIRCGSCILKWAGICTLICFVVLGIWALISFDSLFASLHSIFFANGTWQFPAQSLLIEMYPINFWIGMGLVWLISTSLFSALAIIIGLLLPRRLKQA